MWPPRTVRPLELPLPDAAWTHDPADPVPSAVPNAFAYLQEGNPLLHAWSTRDEVAVLDARPVDEPLDLAGPVTLSAHLSTTGPSTHLFAKLLDVHPSGEAELISHGRIATSSERIEFGMLHVGYRLREGHHLRIHLHSSDFPEFVLHPGTGENPWLAVETVKTHQEVRDVRLRLHVL